MAVVRSLTGTRVDQLLVMLAPSWPRSPFPQQATAPVERRAQVWSSPAATSTPSSIFCTPRGASSTEKPTVWPLPPQQTTPPPRLRAQVWPRPARISTASSRPRTATGRALCERPARGSRAAQGGGA